MKSALPTAMDVTPGTPSPQSEIPILILDGGLGTTLEEKYNVRFSSAETPLWSSHLLLSEQGQKTLLECHGDFVRAGADIVSTATYQASIAGFRNTRTPEWPEGVPPDRIPGFLADAVAIAGKATDGAASAVALSLGPYGATMVPSQEYGGVYDEEHTGVERLAAWHLERLVLCTGAGGLFAGVECVAFETVPRLDEVVAIRHAMGDPELASRIRRDRPAKGPLRYWISCVFAAEDGEGRATLPDGTTAREVVKAMLDCEVSAVRPWGIGINCTKVDKLPALVEEFGAQVREMTTGQWVDQWPSLVLYPDGTNGEVYNPVTQKWELPEGQEKPKQPWESRLARIVEAAKAQCRWGNIAVGGCCKTSPEDIARLRSTVLGTRSNPAHGAVSNRP